MVRGSWIKDGAVVIDVGINPVKVSRLVWLTCLLIFWLLLLKTCKCKRKNLLSCYVCF